jgi:nucleoside-diphosphate-sugar epimerase
MAGEEDVSEISHRRGALVTGGAGFIGGHLAERLLTEGWSVRVLDDFSSGRVSNLAGCEGRVDLVRGDIRDSDTLARALDGVEVIFHQAAVPSVSRSVAEPLRTNSVNIEGTLLVLDAARAAGVRRVVYAASSSAYGDDPTQPKVESMQATALSPYALQKFAGEEYCRLYCVLHGLETVSLRYFNVYGPRQDPESEYAAAIPRFVTAALAGVPAEIYGDGEQTRDFVFIDDVVEANLLAADATAAPGHVMNIAGGRRTSLNELWEEICDLVGVTLEARYAARRPGDVSDSLASVERAGELIGYEPSVDLREGLRRTIESFRKTRESERG